LETERRSSTLTFFKQFDSKVVGSVHSGPVRLRVSETSIPEEEVPDFDHFGLPKTSRKIDSSCTNMEVCGGQAYLPIFKANTLTEQRQNVEHLGHLPLLTQRLLTSPRGSFDQDKTSLTTEVITKFDTLDALLTTIEYELTNTGKNNVRFEFYFTTTLRSPNCDITCPVPDPWKLLLVMDHQVFKEYWSEHLNVYLDPLRNFVSDLKKKKGKSLIVSDICPWIRTTLVLCAERCVEAVNIMGFQGRIIQTIWKELAHPKYEKHKGYFILPATCLVSAAPHRYALRNPTIGSPTPDPPSPSGVGKCIF
jgi:hypothetical protein